MTIEQLRTIAETAQAKLRHVYELYGLGEPPTVTPGLVDAVLEAAGYERAQINTRTHIAQVNDVPAPQKPDRAELDAAVIARLRELAVDGIMPRQAEWNAKRGDLPTSALLYENWGGRKWAQWAALAGLVYAGPNVALHKEAAGSAEATFRQVSERAASVLGPEHVVVSPHGSERNGAGHAARD